MQNKTKSKTKNNSNKITATIATEGHSVIYIVVPLFPIGQLHDRI